MRDRRTGKKKGIGKMIKGRKNKSRWMTRKQESHKVNKENRKQTDRQATIHQQIDSTLKSLHKLNSNLLTTLRRCTVER